ncbi:MAG: hypothetical protein BWY25_03156 [Chloroflexi bacterium ADurb.Bin222]|nr:MAG: hypothetical protein BWY25_03156 [Chloroflexi bacterium ADurb.Bin222]
MRLSGIPHAAISLLYRPWIHIEGHRRNAPRARQPAEKPGVRPQVPNALRRDLFQPGADQGLLVLVRRGRVVGLVVVIPPRRRALAPAQPGRRCLQAIQQAQQPRPTHLAGRAGRNRSRIGVALLGASVKVNVEEQPGLEARRPGQQARGQIQGQAIYVDPEELAQAHIPARHERQGRQEMLAKLPVGDPGPSLLIRFEGEGVYQHRTPGVKLDVVSAAVFQGHAEIKRTLLNPQRRQRRVLQLTETPLIGIGDEGDLQRSQNAIRQFRARSG